MDTSWPPEKEKKTCFFTWRVKDSHAIYTAKTNLLNIHLMSLSILHLAFSSLVLNKVWRLVFANSLLVLTSPSTNLLPHCNTHFSFWLSYFLRLCSRPLSNLSSSSKALHQRQRQKETKSVMQLTETTLSLMIIYTHNVHVHVGSDLLLLNNNNKPEA